MKCFGELTKAEVAALSEYLQTKAGDYRLCRISGFSGGSFDLYDAIDEVVVREWRKARRSLERGVVDEPLDEMWMKAQSLRHSTH